MAGRKWHLEHRDGREWTSEELDDIATREYEDPARCDALLVDQSGRPWILFGPLGCGYAILDDEDDMVVVWDE